MADYEDAMGGNVYAEDTFLEADEDETNDQQQPPYHKAIYSASDSKVRYDEDGDERPQLPPGTQTVRSAESFLNDTLPEYSHPDETNWYGCGGGVRKEQQRTRRRRSRELAENDVLVTSNEDEPKRKPETMRSISEDTPTRTIKQPVTRRTLSHPEKDAQVVSGAIDCVRHERILTIFYTHFSRFVFRPQNERTSSRKFRARNHWPTSWSERNVKNRRRFRRHAAKIINRSTFQTPRRRQVKYTIRIRACGARQCVRMTRLTGDTFLGYSKL